MHCNYYFLLFGHRLHKDVILGYQQMKRSEVEGTVKGTEFLYATDLKLV